MSNYIATDTDLTAVANAIRTKGGTSAQLAFPAGFVSAINDISGGGGTYVLNPPVKVITGTLTLASADYIAKVLIDPDILDVNDYQLHYAHVIMLNEYWSDYEGNSTYDNRAVGLVLPYPQYFYETTISSTKYTEIFLSSNANNHSWKSGGTFNRDFTNNGFNLQTAGNSYKFIPGVPYQYVIVAYKILS